MPESILVYDIGGTYLRGALYCPVSDKLLEPTRWHTPHFSEYKGEAPEVIFNAVLEKMDSLGKMLTKDCTPDVVSIAFPGPIDAGGQVLTAPTIWGRAGDKPLPIKKHLQRLWPQSKIILLNDVSASGFNYVHDSNDSLCVVTVSSGVGHKVFIDGKPVVGHGGYGGEIGHWRIDYSDSAPMCECGHKGHLGALASGRASRWQAQRLQAENPGDYENSMLSEISSTVDSLNNEDYVRAFHNHDKWSIKLISRLADPLGNVLAGIHLIIGIERFIIMGGFALALGEPYRQLVCKAAASAGWDLGVDWDKTIQLGDSRLDAGLIGAGRYARQSLNLIK